MSWPLRHMRRSGNVFFLIATVVCILITILNYNVLKEVAPSDRWTEPLLQEDWQKKDIQRRLAHLEEKVFGKAYNSNQQQNDLSQRIEKLEEHLSSEKPKKEDCKIPNDWHFPFCKSKVQWMQQLWKTNSACYVGRHNLQPESLCSILIYLSEVERFCPVLPWRRKNVTKEHEVAKMRFELEDTFINTLNKMNLRWIRDRITQMWPQWVSAAREFASEGSLRRQHHVKKIFIFFGTYAYQPSWLDRAYHGAPLGEMVQWSDLLAALYVLGHDLTIADNSTTYKQHLTVPKVDGCADNFTPEFDLIYTDYNGLTYFAIDIRHNLSPYRCRIRILDSFGTEPEFNFGAYQGQIPGGKSTWANADLNLRQIFTMFPHSPDNSFLGFVVGDPLPADVKPSKKKPIGLVYGKDVQFWTGKREYLDTLHKYLEIHGTFFGITKEDIKKNVPDYVITHGILSKPDLEKLLQDTKVFIGLGFPYEGPAPLEAIAEGCIFLNAKFDPPHNRLNTAFFKNKPTLRELTSQHPYAEVFIGEPHVISIDIKNLSLVEETVKSILNTEVKPYLPLEWTAKGMLERVNAFNEYYLTDEQAEVYEFARNGHNILITGQAATGKSTVINAIRNDRKQRGLRDFCEHGERWPPLSEMKLFLGEIGKSCVEVCKMSDLLCESFYFIDVNDEQHLQKFGVKCNSVVREDSLSAPCYNPSTQQCSLQTQPLLFSCVKKDPDQRRLCPCRDFQAQQVAFCKQCH